MNVRSIQSAAGSAHSKVFDTASDMPTSSQTHLVLIPTYNTGAKVVETVREALAVWLPVWVVVDGSTDGSDLLIDELAESEPNLRVLKQSPNQGKGAAVLKGITEAEGEGFQYVLTMDADGQHPANRITDFMRVSQENPGSMVLGKPVFGDEAPALRVNGRKVSNFWAQLETLWGGIGDSLFGFRIYPIADLRAVMEKNRWSRRFDFDPEVAVRLFWRGVTPVNVEADVKYLTAEEGGVSQFRYLRDNTLLTWMHARLMVGFFLRLPKLIWWKLFRKKHTR